MILTEDLRNHLAALQVPYPVTTLGNDIQEILSEHYLQVKELFEDANDVGMPLKVHTMQVLQGSFATPRTVPYDNCKYCVVSFVVGDSTNGYMQSAMKLLQRTNSEIEKLDCTHEFGADMKCIYCGAVI